MLRLILRFTLTLRLKFARLPRLMFPRLMFPRLTLALRLTCAWPPPPRLATCTTKSSSCAATAGCVMVPMFALAGADANENSDSPKMAALTRPLRLICLTPWVQLLGFNSLRVSCSCKRGPIVPANLGRFEVFGTSILRHRILQCGITEAHKQEPRPPAGVPHIHQVAATDTDPRSPGSGSRRCRTSNNPDRARGRPMLSPRPP